MAESFWKSVGRKLRAALETYFKVISYSHSKLSHCELINQWKVSQDVNTLLDLKKLSSEPHTFGETECLFYFAQKDEQRIGFVSQDIDEDYVCPDLHVEEEECIDEEPMDIVNDDKSDDKYVCEDVSQVPASSKPEEVRRMRSGTVLTSPDPVLVTPKPALGGKRNCTEEIKAACSKVSYECGISVEKAKKAVQDLCKELYSHKYFLTLEEKEGPTMGPKKRRR